MFGVQTMLSQGNAPKWTEAADYAGVTCENVFSFLRIFKVRDSTHARV